MNISKELAYLCKIASRSSSNVLIQGPTGTGKTTLARQIHMESERKDRPFISINLATLHEGTLEAELFGHEKGAFTSAEAKRIGKLELAQGGTVFLDEIGDLSPRLQARLLDFLQMHKISPMGSNREISLDVRVITATHRDLSLMVRKREFREDLFHRLRVIAIETKSLRDREDDFDQILHSCLQDVCRATKRTILGLSTLVAECLETYSWPGNIRELRNVLEFAVLASEGPQIQIEHLPEWFRGALATAPLRGGEKEDDGSLADLISKKNFYEAQEFFEREYFTRALSRNGGRIARTARQIGVNKTTLLRRIRAYQIQTFPHFDPEKKKLKKALAREGALGY